MADQTTMTEERTDLIEHITSYKQADEDGVMVIVSRQACDEAAAAIRSLSGEVENYKTQFEQTGDTLLVATDAWAARCRELKDARELLKQMLDCDKRGARLESQVQSFLSPTNQTEPEKV